MNTILIQLLNIYKKYTRSLIINEKDRSQKNTLLTIYIIFTLLSSSILILFAIKPALSTVTSLQQQLSDSKKVEEALSTKLQALATLDATYANLTPYLPRVFQAIPRQAEIASASRQIEKIASNNNLSISSFTVNSVQLNPAPQPSAVASAAFTITVQGSGDNINQFIRDVSSFDRIVTIESISKGKADNQNNTQASITGQVYYFDKQL